MEVILIGDGGHSKVIQEMILTMKGYRIIAILDDKFTHVQKVNQMIYAPIAYVHQLANLDTKFILAIGDNATRTSFSRKFPVREDQYLTIVHPTAIVSPTAKLGHGTVVMPLAVIHTKATVGNHCIINTASIVEHDNQIGHFSHISPNATLAGNVSIGEGVHVGSAATVIPGVTIDRWSVIGAGSTVIHDIPAFTTAVGSPTRIVKQRKEKSGIRG